MVDGLYAGDSTLTVDFATVAYRIQLLGFNAIRLPFSFLVRSHVTLTCHDKRIPITPKFIVHERLSLSYTRAGLAVGSLPEHANNLHTLLPRVVSGRDPQQRHRPP